MVTRIRQLLEYKQLSPTQFADLIGVGRPVMSHILSERNKPSLEVVKQMSAAFPDVSLPWLLFGAGEMLGAEVGSLPAFPPPMSELPASPAPQAEAPEAPLIEAATAPAALPPPQAALPRPFSAPQPPPLPALPEPDPVPEASPAPVVLPEVPEVAAKAAPVAPQPFRAARFVPAAVPGPAPVTTAPLALPAAGPAPLAPQAAPLPSPPAMPAAPGTLPASMGNDAALLPFLSESGKAIRRIVIFYRDGSFADYQPE